LEAESIDVDVHLETRTYPSSHLDRKTSFVPIVTPSVVDSVPSGASVVSSLRGLCGLKGCKNVLSKLNYDSVSIYRVLVLPPSFNGDVIFKLHVADANGISSHAKQMTSIDKRYDGHI